MAPFGHRKNILTPGFRELGIGYQPNETFQGYKDATLWSQEFGTRK
ncbi:MAG: CAP domain-containing protein [Gaiellaceae bacterium]